MKNNAISLVPYSSFSLMKKNFTIFNMKMSECLFSTFCLYSSMCNHYNAMVINIFTVASRFSILHKIWLRTKQITTPFIPTCRINLRNYLMLLIDQRMAISFSKLHCTYSRIHLFSILFQTNPEQHTKLPDLKSNYPEYPENI